MRFPFFPTDILGGRRIDDILGNRIFSSRLLASRNNLGYLSLSFDNVDTIALSVSAQSQCMTKLTVRASCGKMFVETLVAV